MTVFSRRKIILSSRQLIENNTGKHLMEISGIDNNLVQHMPR